jgi:glucosamine-6-phosphate deaminase
MASRDYYSIPSESFHLYSGVKFVFLESFEALCMAVAEDLANLIKEKSKKGKMTKVILPVGPIEISYFADRCNKENISCESLIIYAMDEYLTNDGVPISLDHPLSFRAFFERSLNQQLNPDLRLPPDQLILPDPANINMIQESIQKYGQIDMTYGGFGINGHFAFNSPPKEKIDLEAFKNTTVREVELREGDIIQFAINGTLGNIEIIPTKACTLGMSELLSAKAIHLTFMRPWHAGVMRRALFGPITPQFPGSLVQTHPNLKAYVTPDAAQIPSIDLLMRQK